MIFRAKTTFWATLCMGMLLLSGLSAEANASPQSKPKPTQSIARVQFNRDIRQILSENCFTCHGPDSAARKANLRLDLREGALARKAIVAGKPEQSGIIKRIFAPANSPLVMPPKSAQKQLTPTEKTLLRRWIAEGATYEKHWAFQKLPAAVPLPSVKKQDWVKTPVDRFILARLEKERLSPSTPATKAVWIRRVSLDLTGLPPTLAESDAFMKDDSPQAYQRVVDRLMKSPRYGEHFAVSWLDLARYADSYGYQSDLLSPTYPYRDWVVRAFNSNMPYDRFLTYQIAGDLVPEATNETRLATAFNRLHRMTNEGGSVPEEWREEGVADRVRTFGTAFLGLTLECARCHDHKYDPISQREFYSLASFFNNIDEYGLYDQANIVPTPTLLLPASDQKAGLENAKAAAAQSVLQYQQVRKDRATAFETWLAAQTPETWAKATTVLPDQTGLFEFEEFQGAVLKNQLPNSKDNGSRLDEVPLTTGKFGKAAQLDGENNVNFPNLGRFTRHTPFTIAFWMQDTLGAKEPIVIFHASSGTDAGPHGYDLLLNDGILTARLFRHWPGNAIAVRSKVGVARNTWTHIAVTYDGSSRASGLKIYQNGKLAALDTVRDGMVKGLGQHTLAFGQRFRDKGFKGGQIDTLAIFNRDISPLEVNALFVNRPIPMPTDKNDAAYQEFYLSAIDTEVRAAKERLATAREQVWRHEDNQFEIPVMQEMEAIRPTHILARGQYDAPRTPANLVSRGTPEALLKLPNNLRKDRLGLAAWLTHKDNPLTARVAVNRLWFHFFGAGIVETIEDFGIQGRLPSHPELLDWLAVDLIASKWDIQQTIRQIVLSATYRQSSAFHPELRKKDPRNVLLARGASYRLPGEVIRDQALFAAGLLNETVGGSPVRPYQPGDLWREVNAFSPPYQQSKGADLYRRSLYSIWKRTAPLPNMLAFDASGREVCVARRQATNTPIQALTLLNDVQFVEASRKLGERTLREGGSDDASRVRFVFRLLAVREPSPDELRLLTSLYQSQRAAYQANPQEAQKLLKVGESPADATLNPTEVAAATLLAQAVLNLDSTVWRR